MTTDNTGVPTAEDFLLQTAGMNKKDLDNQWYGVPPEVGEITQYMKAFVKLHLEAQRHQHWRLLNDLGIDDIEEQDLNTAYNIEENVK